MLKISLMINCIILTGLLYLDCSKKKLTNTIFTELIALMFDDMPFGLKMYRKRLARESLHHCSNDVTFSRLFPELKQEIDEKLASNPGRY